MNKQLFILVGFVVLMSGCKSAPKIQSTEALVTATEIFEQYGAPANIQKISGFEVWTYEDSNAFRTEKCQLSFKKNKLSSPVKCFTTRREPADKKGPGSRKFVINY